jgi:hypothetical protein
MKMYFVFAQAILLIPIHARRLTYSLLAPMFSINPNMTLDVSLTVLRGEENHCLVGFCFSIQHMKQEKDGGTIFSTLGENVTGRWDDRRNFSKCSWNLIQSTIRSTFAQSLLFPMDGTSLKM